MMGFPKELGEVFEVSGMIFKVCTNQMINSLKIEKAFKQNF